MRNFKIIISGLGGILVLIIVIPLARMILSADPGVVRSTVSDPEVFQSILLTLRAALWATLSCVLFGVPLAYALAYRLPQSSALVSVLATVNVHS